MGKWASRLTRQLSSLATKNFIVLRQKPVSTVALLLSSAIFVGVLSLAYDGLTAVTYDLSPLSVSRCTRYDITGLPAVDDGPPCVTLMYAPQGDAVVEGIMAILAARTGLSIANASFYPAQSDILGVPSGKAAAEWLLDHITGTLVDHVLVFDTKGVDQAAGAYTGAVQYSLWLNSSTVGNAAQSGLDPVWMQVGAPGRALALQKEVDAAIIAYGLAVAQGQSVDSGVVSSSIDVRMRAFSDWQAPLSEGFVSGGGNPGGQLMLLAGGALLAMGPVMAAVLLTSFLSAELHADLKAYLQSNGLLESAYVLSWMAIAAPLALLAAILGPAAGMASKLALFTQVDYSVMLVLFTLGGLAFTAQALFLSAFFLPTKLPINLPSGLLLVSTVLVTIMCALTDGYAVMYAPNTPGIATFILFIFPAMHWGRIVQTLIYIVYTGSTQGMYANQQQQAAEQALGKGAAALVARIKEALHFPVYASTSDMRATSSSSSPPSDGIAFTWADLYNPPPPVAVQTGDEVVLWQDNPPGWDLAMLLCVTCLYLLLAWYYGHFQGSSKTLDRSKKAERRHGCCFPCDPRYWGCMRPARSKEAEEEGNTLGEVQRLSALEGSIRVHKVSKKFGGNGAAALTEVNLVVPPGQLLALLGQNGAGKTTLMHCLLGDVPMTHGDAYVCGLTPRQDGDALRQETGCCPQDDPLWPGLTAKQHLVLMANFKNVPESTLSDRVTSMLESVNLASVADAPVGPFSGGMKRRMSVAMAAIGDPRLLVLDEPTTGLDPLARRGVWDIITKLRASRPGRIVLLTTHNLAEADALGDAVAILAGGKMRAVGTPLFLKTRFGQGYSLQLLVEPSRIAEVEGAVRAYLPGAILLGETGEGSLGDASKYLQATTAPLPSALLVPESPVAPSSSRGSSTTQSTGCWPCGRGKNNGTGRSTGPVADATPSQRTGAFTVSIPRGSIRHLPSFLRWLQVNSGRPQEGLQGDGGRAGSVKDKPLIREWGISNSTLEEVFLRLAGSSAVNAPVGGSGSDASAAMAVPMPVLGDVGHGGPGDGAGVRQDKVLSTLPETAPGVCALCLSSATTPVTLYTSLSVAVLATDLACAACAQSRGLADILPIRALQEEKAELLAAPVSEQQASLLLQQHPMESVPAGQEGLSAPLLAKEPAEEAGVGQHKAGKAEVQPVPFATQFLAVFQLRLRLALKVGALLFTLILVALGACLQVFLDPRLGQGPPPLTQCAQGYYTQDEVTGLCDRSTFVEFMAGAVGRTNPSPVGSAEGQSLNASASSLQFPNADLLYQPYCPQHDKQSGQCTSPGQPGEWPTSTDWQQSSIVSAPTSKQRSTAVVWHYTDPSPPNLPIAQWDVYGPGAEGVQVGGDGRVIWPWVAELRPITGGGKGVTAIDARVTAAMQTVYNYATLITNGSCQDQGVPVAYNGDSEDFLTVAWQWGQDEMDKAADWTANNLPSLGISLAQADIGSGTASGYICPALSYDLAMWAAECTSSGSAICPTRSQGYTWAGNGALTVTDLTGGQWTTCYRPGVSQPADYPWPPVGTSNGAGAYPSSAALSAVHNAWYRSVVRGNGLTAQLPSPVIRTALVEIPPISWVGAADVGGSSLGLTLTPLLFPMFTLFLLMGQSYYIAEEKSKRLFSLMRLSGMRLGPYFTACYAFAFLQGLLVRLVYMGTGMAASDPSFFLGDWQQWLGLLLASSHEQAGFALLIGASVPSPWTATAVSLLVTLAVSVGSFLCSIFVSPWPRALTWVPLISGARAASLVLSVGGEGINPRSELGKALTACTMYGFLAAGLAVCVHCALPGPAGAEAGADGLTWKQVYATCHALVQAVRGIVYPSIGLDVRGEYAQLAEGEGAVVLMEGAGAGEGVAAERARVRAIVAGGDGTVPALLLHGLGKVFPTKAKPAVLDLHLTVAPGEALSLLGPNGAGKTTTISMITGGTGISSGKASVCGYDVARDLSRAWRMLGVCPQFDAVWDGLTVQAHLEFFAALKGTGRWGQAGGGGAGAQGLGADSGRPQARAIRSVAQSMAERVGLDGDPLLTVAGSLSGGMRRRLSLGIAMLGEPHVMLLDEPTTGLDPETRRSIHKIISAYRALPGRSLVLTTHALDESDALSDRVAIMAQGQLQAVGSAQRLKQRYGSGYTLTLTLAVPGSASSEEVERAAGRAFAYVRERVHAQAEEVSRVAGTLTVHIPRQNAGKEVDVADLFASMQGLSSHTSASIDPAGGRGSGDRESISDWGLCQPSLEDVFVAVCKGMT